MILYQRTQAALISVLEQTHGRRLSTEHELLKEEVRSAGNILHCASLYSFQEIPHRFLPDNPAFQGKESMLGSEFMLPDQFTYIEDNISGVGLVDALKNQKGTKSRRAFLHIESASALHLTEGINFSESFRVLVETPEVFDESIWVHAGFVMRMDPLSPNEPADAQFHVELGVRSLILIETSGKIRVCLEPYALKGDGELSNSGLPVARSREMMKGIAGNLRCGMRELAYYQASRKSIDCKVRLVREGQ